MLFLRKTSFLVLFSAALLVSAISLNYMVTLNRQGHVDRPFSDPSSILSSLNVGQRIGPNVYAAGSPFESKVTRYLNADGCPCPDVTKFEVLVGMATTREFFLNLLVWAVPISVSAFLLHRRWVAKLKQKEP
jgi:hypothetical protein